MPVPSAATIFRDFVVDGIPATGAHNPIKSEIRDWAERIQSIVNAAWTYDTRAHAAAAVIPAEIKALAIRGFYYAGDGGAGIYIWVSALTAGLIGFQSADGEWWQLAEPVVTVDMAGARGNWDGQAVTGTNDAAAFQAAMNHVAALGSGPCLIGPKDYLIDANLTIPMGVSLMGLMSRITPATNDTGGTAYQALLRKYRLTVNSAATITLMGGANASSMRCVRKGMAYTGTTLNEHNEAAFAGTLFYSASSDPCVENIYAIGFAQAFNTVGSQRVRARDLQLDCIAGVRIETAVDVSIVENVHTWPFGVAGGGGDTSITTANEGYRSGDSVKLVGKNDGTKIINCFSFAHGRGFVAEADGSAISGGQIKFINCWADSYASGSAVIAGTVGFDIQNGDEVSFDGCQASAMDFGRRIFGATPTSKHVAIGCNSWHCNIHEYAEGSQPIIHGGYMRSSKSVTGFGNYGLRCVSPPKPPIVMGAVFDDLYIGIDTGGAAASGCIGNQFLSIVGGVAIVNAALPTLASANPISLAGLEHCQIVQITGTVSFDTITPTFAGDRKIFEFTGALTVVTGSGNIDNLGGSIGTAAGMALTFICTGTRWSRVT